MSDERFVQRLKSEKKIYHLPFDISHLSFRAVGVNQFQPSVRLPTIHA